MKIVSSLLAIQLTITGAFIAPVAKVQKTQQFQNYKLISTELNVYKKSLLNSHEIYKDKDENFIRDVTKFDVATKHVKSVLRTIPSIAYATIIFTLSTFTLNTGNTFDVAYAASSSRSSSTSSLETEKAKIVKGYKRLDYLLKNWEKETTLCAQNDNPYQGCDRSPLKVMEYLGYKSMNDPLFRADKTLIKLQVLVPDKNIGEYQDAVDTWIEKAEEGNGMAFVSSWGEANPGGGKDRVEFFIERSKNDVIAAQKSLKTVIDILELSLD